MASAYAETQGDLYLIKGDKKAAYESYQLALQTVSSADSRSRSILELKLNQVVPNSETAVKQPEISEEGA